MNLMLGDKLERVVLSKIGGSLFVLDSCGGIAWYISGCILRWNGEGKLCSGNLANIDGVTAPYMYKSGKFI